MLIQQIQLDGFQYKAADVEMPMADKTVRTMKVLTFHDRENLKVGFHFVFSPEAFEDFIQNISNKKIIEAESVPKNIIQFPK